MAPLIKKGRSLETPQSGEGSSPQATVIITPQEDPEPRTFRILGITAVLCSVGLAAGLAWVVVGEEAILARVESFLKPTPDETVLDGHVVHAAEEPLELVEVAALEPPLVQDVTPVLQSETLQRLDDLFFVDTLDSIETAIVRVQGLRDEISAAQADIEEFRKVPGMTDAMTAARRGIAVREAKIGELEEGAREASAALLDKALVDQERAVELLETCARGVERTRLVRAFRVALRDLPPGGARLDAVAARTVRPFLSR